MYFNDDEDKAWSYSYSYEETTVSTPAICIIYFAVGGVIILLILACCCCCRKRRNNRGQILSTSMQPSLNTSAPYPQQLYAQPIYNGPVTTLPPVPPAPNNVYPASGPNSGVAPYPVMQYSLPYQSMPNPHAAAPYPTTGAPYPSTGAPYMSPGAPYPTVGAPHPTPMYQHSTAPSAPDASIFLGLAPPGWNAAVLPPTYDQAVGVNKTH